LEQVETLEKDWRKQGVFLTEEQFYKFFTKADSFQYKTTTVIVEPSIVARFYFSSMVGPFYRIKISCVATIRILEAFTLENVQLSKDKKLFKQKEWKYSNGFD
jgi:hypothetical protein